jgi:hypothetical protein
MAVVLARCPECRADNAVGARHCIVCLHRLPATEGAVEGAVEGATGGVTEVGQRADASTTSAPVGRETIAVAFLDNEPADVGDVDRAVDAPAVCTAVIAVLVVVACLAVVCWSLVVA